MRILRAPTMYSALNASNLFQGPNSTASKYGQFPGLGSNSSAAATRVIANGIDITHKFVTSNTNFPPASWLGYGLDMITITPMDMVSVASSVLSHTRVITIVDNGTEQEHNGVTWMVPDNVDVSPSVTVTGENQVLYKGGEQAAHDLSLDSSLAGSYMAVQGDISASYAIKKAFSKTYQYDLFNYNALLLDVKVSNYGHYVDEKFLSRTMDRIPKWDPTKPDVIEEYRSLFSTIGSHIITGVNYGGRLQLNVWADNDDSSVDKEFRLDVGAEFNGITTGGKINAGIKTESQFQAFSESVQKTCSCLGGDAQLCGNIGSNPEQGGAKVYESYQAWIHTALTNPNIVRFQTAALWDIMNWAVDPDVARRGPDVDKAYQWIVENPEEHLTTARLTITSNWGEIGILTPSAYIIRDPQNPPPPGVTISTTKITWDSHGGIGREIIIDFIIVNDGSPIDIELSHGSEGSGPGTGSAMVEFSGKSYENKGITDNNWNTLKFLSCPVDPHGRIAPSNSLVNVSRK